MSLGLTWLDKYFRPPVIQGGGEELPERRIIDFEGDGVTVADDNGGKRTVVTIAGGGGDGLPAGGDEGDALRIVSGVPAWAALPEELPSGGVDGDSLRIVDGVPAWEPDPDAHYTWTFGSYTFDQAAIDGDGFGRTGPISIMFVDSASPCTITLPTAATVEHKPRIVTVVDWGRTATTTNAITIDTPDGKLINGASSAQITAKGGSLTFVLFQETLSLYHWVILGEKAASAIGGGGGSLIQEIPLILGEQTTTDSAPYRKGARQIDWTQFPATLGTLAREVKLVATLDSSISSGVDAVLDLYDLAHGVQIGSSQISNTAAPDKTHPTEVSSASLTLGTSSGNLRTDGLFMYLARLSRSGGSSANAVTCTNARMRIAYV